LKILITSPAHIEEHAPYPLTSLRLRLHEMLSAAFVRQVLAMYATRIVLIAIGLATTVIVARILGPEGRGLYAVATAIGAIGVQCGTLGLHTVNSYAVAKDRSRLPGLLGNSLAASAIVGALAVAGPYAVFATWPELSPLGGSLLFLALLSIPFGLAYTLVQSLLLGVNAVATYNRTELANRGLALVMIVAATPLHLVSPQAVFAVGLAMTAGTGAAAVCCLVRLSGCAPRPSWELFGSNLPYGLRAYLGTFFCFLVSRTDVLMLKYLSGAEAAGYYSIAGTMADNVAILPVIVASLLLPKLSATADIGCKYVLMRTAAVGVTVILAPLFAATVLLAPWAVRALFGKDFAPAAPAYVWLMPGMLFLSIEVVAVQFLNSIGYPIVVVWIWLGCVVFKVVANLWVIPLYGITGVSVVASFAYFAAFALISAVIYRKAHGPRDSHC
jgi:O-antigen/teichoic acid export membrane protein